MSIERDQPSSDLIEPVRRIERNAGVLRARLSAQAHQFDALPEGEAISALTGTIESMYPESVTAATVAALAVAEARRQPWVPPNLRIRQDPAQTPRIVGAALGISSTFFLGAAVMAGVAELLHKVPTLGLLIVFAAISFVMLAASTLIDLWPTAGPRLAGRGHRVEKDTTR